MVGALGPDGRQKGTKLRRAGSDDLNWILLTEEGRVRIHAAKVTCAFGTKLYCGGENDAVRAGENADGLSLVCFLDLKSSLTA